MSLMSSSSHRLGGGADDLFLLSGTAGLSEHEALIKVELDVIKPGVSAAGPGDPPEQDLRIANVQFNNLDFVGE